MSADLHRQRSTVHACNFLLAFMRSRSKSLFAASTVGCLAQSSAISHSNMTLRAVAKAESNKKTALKSAPIALLPGRPHWWSLSLLAGVQTDAVVEKVVDLSLQRCVGGLPAQATGVRTPRARLRSWWHHSASLALATEAPLAAVFECRLGWSSAAVAPRLSCSGAMEVERIRFDCGAAFAKYPSTGAERCRTSDCSHGGAVVDFRASALVSGGAVTNAEPSSPSITLSSDLSHSVRSPSPSMGGRAAARSDAAVLSVTSPLETFLLLVVFAALSEEYSLAVRECPTEWRHGRGLPAAVGRRKKWSSSAAILYVNEGCTVCLYLRKKRVSDFWDVMSKKHDQIMISNSEKHDFGRTSPVIGCIGAWCVFDNRDEASRIPFIFLVLGQRGIFAGGYPGMPVRVHALTWPACCCRAPHEVVLVSGWRWCCHPVIRMWTCLI